MASGLIHRWLEHPLTRGLDLDDPRTTDLRRELVRRKTFLRRLYREWYALLGDALPAGAGAVVELGSGAGSIREVLPEVLTSDVLSCAGVRVVADAQRLPFAAASLRGLLMVNVLHHVARCRDFFLDAARCVRTGGAIVGIEPWVTPWSRLVYAHLHHEPFDPDAERWHLASGGPLSGANGALPWIVLERDRAVFEREFPCWRIRRVKPLMPVSYLLSGGVSLRSFAPGWAYPAVRFLESAGDRLAAMFALIELERTDAQVPP